VLSGVIKSKYEKPKMNGFEDKSKTNLSRTSMSPRRSAVPAQKQRSPPSQKRMTIAMLLQQEMSNQSHPEDEDSAEAQRRRVCSYLEQALDIEDAAESDCAEYTIGDVQEPLSAFILSLPANLALVSDNAKSASQPAAHPAGKPAKACRWSETKASVASPKSPSRLRAVYVPTLSKLLAFDLVALDL
jgi:hypothetical protein